MAVEPVGKRRYHAFLSHAHVDKDKADRLVAWLKGTAAIPVWYDRDDLAPGATIATALPVAIAQSRALILLLSKQSVERGWVEHEYNAAIDHQTHHRTFRIIPVKLDDVEAPGFLKNYSSLAFSSDRVDRAFSISLLRGLYDPQIGIDLVRARSTYLSRGWHLDDAQLADEISLHLTNAGLQLIGDAEDHPSWEKDRIVRIIEGCGAFAAILPYRPQSPHKTSKYVLTEWQIAANLGLPCFVIADSRVELPLEVKSFGGYLENVETIGGAAAAATAFAEDWKAPNRASYVFYATDFSVDGQETRDSVRELIEIITMMPCIVGEYVRGAVVQQEILRTVSRATLVLADITEDSPNVYVELGVALASGVPLYLLRKGPPGRPAFMLRNQQVWDYMTETDLIGRITQIVYAHRRTLLRIPRRVN